MMKKSWLFLLIITLIWSCSTVPITGRKQLSLIPESQLLPLSFAQYDSVLQANQLSDNQHWKNMVQNVGNNIRNAVEKYMADHNMSDQLDGYKWEFHLIKSDKVNAWCLPGGKVAFYTGIMPICEDKAGVAVVMGHEVAHAVARHGAERMSQGLVQQLGGVALAVALRDKPQETQQLFGTAYALGTTYGAMLPYSRLQESEADKLGLIFMAMAGYDPHEAPEFWQRMEAQNGGQQPPEFLSTHPSHEHRIQDLNDYMSKAMKYYDKNNSSSNSGNKTKSIKVRRN